MSSPHPPLIRKMACTDPKLVRYSRKKSVPQNHFHRQQSEVLSNMTSVTIGKQVAPNARHFGETFKTLFRWKDSVYRLLWRHMLTYYILHILLTVLYYVILGKEQKKTFRKVTSYVTEHGASFNLMIMLGFFTSAALQRLFSMQSAMPGTARVISVFILALKPDIPGATDMIEQYSRWAVLSWLLTFRIICKPLRELFPDMISLQKRDLITETERVILERVETMGDTTPRPLIVIDWMILLLKETMLRDQYLHKSCYAKCIESLLAFKKCCGNTIKLTAKNIPYAVIQAVIISVYFFGVVTILARELPLDKEQMSLNSTMSGWSNSSDSSNSTATEQTYTSVEFVFFIFPILPFMKFFIVFSWLTFGRAAVNPFGDDYTDIDVIQLLEAHLEDKKRLKKLYSAKLDEIFSILPPRKISSAVVIESLGATTARKRNQQNSNDGAEEECQIITVTHHQE